MFAPKVVSDSVPIAAAMRRSRDRPVMSLTVRRSMRCSCLVHDSTNWTASPPMTVNGNSGKRSKRSDPKAWGDFSQAGEDQ
jgi:hypothetical protein